jgi:haloacetate dehalogenase
MTRFEDLDQRLLPEFRRLMIDVGEGPIRVLIGGEGPPLLMLHGDPQTHLCWHEIAPELCASHTVVLTDIRGRGESHKPTGADIRFPYTKRAMAAEQVAVMDRLGFGSFAVAGHDRGARVARRMAMDHPGKIEKLVVMDVVPSIDLYEKTNAQIAQDYYYFFFLTQPSPIAEKLIGGDPRSFMGQILTGLPGASVPYDQGALELYLQSSTTPEAIAAMCECFRTGRTQDVEIDREDRMAGTKIKCPTLVMWGTRGLVGQCFDLNEIWSGWADRPEFAPIDCGHFIPEEAPEEATALLQGFLTRPAPGA